MSKAPTTRKIREYCDGELTEQEAASVARTLGENPELEAIADFERRLRQEVSEALSETAPPSELADSIRQALAAENDSPGWESETPATRPAVVVPHKPLRWTWRAPVQANAFAVAASLVLVVGAVLFGIFGQSIDSWRSGTLDIAVEAAGAVAGEHVEAVRGPMRAPRYDTPDQASEGLAQYLGSAGCVYDLSDLGYTFVGGDTCDVPHCQRGCHLVYKRTGGQPRGMITLHVLPEPRNLQIQGTAGLKKFPMATDVIGQNQGCPMDVLIWSYGKRCYLLSVCIAQDAEQIAVRMQEKLLAAGG
jgi:hypothetical protein